jgi:hypothetical protein
LHSTSPSVIFRLRMILLNLHRRAILWFHLYVLKSEISILVSVNDVVLDKGLHEEGFNFISKPLSPNVLLQKVRDVLDK